MLESKERKNGIILSYISIIINTIIQLLYTPLLINRLGTSEYGIYSLAVSTISYLTILDFGFGDAIVMYTAKYHAQNQHDKIKKIHSMIQLIFTIISIIVIIVGFLVYLNIPNIFDNSMTKFEINKMKILFIILIFNLAITFLFSIYSSIIKAYERFTFQKIISIANSLLQPIIMIPLLLLGFKSITLAIVITLINIGVLTLNYIYCRKRLNVKINNYYFDKKLFKQIISYSFFIFLNIVIDKINWSTDQLILGIYVGSAAVTVYSIASKISEMFILLSGAINNVMLPKITKMIAKNATSKDLTDEFIKIGRLQYIIIFLMASGLVLFGKEFFTLWVGKEYIETYYISILLILPISIPLIQNLGISILQAKNLHKFRSLVYLAIAITNVMISIPLTKLYGGIGAAIGTALSLIIGNIIIINIYYYKKIKLDIPKFWKNILTMTIPFMIPITIIIIAMKYIKLHGISYLLFFGGNYTIIYFIICYNFSMNNYEKNIVKNFFKKIKLKKVIK